VNSDYSINGACQSQPLRVIGCRAGAGTISGGERSRTEISRARGADEYQGVRASRHLEQPKVTFVVIGSAAQHSCRRIAAGRDAFPCLPGPRLHSTPARLPRVSELTRNFVVYLKSSQRLEPNDGIRTSRQRRKGLQIQVSTEASRSQRGARPRVLIGTRTGTLHRSHVLGSGGLVGEAADARCAAVRRRGAQVSTVPGSRCDTGWSRRK
jgi:hypothetical protein